MSCHASMIAGEQPSSWKTARPLNVRRASFSARSDAFSDETDDHAHGTSVRFQRASQVTSVHSQGCDSPHAFRTRSLLHSSSIALCAATVVSTSHRPPGWTTQFKSGRGVANLLSVDCLLICGSSWRYSTITIMLIAVKWDCGNCARTNDEVWHEKGS